MLERDLAELYDATFDPWDLLAYGSILIPILF